jgi:hypothetical protein
MIMDSDKAGTELDPAAKAFTELGDKVSLLEAAITGLTAKRDAAPDYGETLGEIAALQNEMGEEISALAQRPAMQLTPDVMAERIAAAGERARASDRAGIEQARTRFDKAANRIEHLIGTAVSAYEQRRRLLWAICGGLLAGMFLWSFLPGVILRALPQSWHMPENMARHIIGEPTLWEAGARLMQAHDPNAWRAIVAADEMRRNNRKTIETCEQKAVKATKAVRCSVLIAADKP